MVVVYVGCGPPPSNSYHKDYSIFSRESQPKPSFVTVTARGPPPRYITPYSLPKCWICVLLTQIFGGGACQNLDARWENKHDYFAFPTFMFRCCSVLAGPKLYLLIHDPA